MRIKHKRTREIVCPYCGHKQSSGCELYARGLKTLISVHCEDCEAAFDVSVHTETTFTTIKSEDRDE